MADTADSVRPLHATGSYWRVKDRLLPPRKGTNYGDKSKFDTFSPLLSPLLLSFYTQRPKQQRLKRK